MKSYDLSNFVLFQGMTPEQLELVTPLVETCRFSSGDTIFEQNEYAEFLYIIRTGEVLINFKPHDGDIIPVSKIQTGGVFGWSSVLGRALYTSAATCAKDCHCYRIRGKELQKLCEEHPETGIIILERLAEVVADRLSSTNSQIVHLLSESMEPEGEELRKKGHDHQ
jgi:CRP-like cAMP-binding protein